MTKIPLGRKQRLNMKEGQRFAWINILQLLLFMKAKNWCMRFATIKEWSHKWNLKPNSPHLYDPTNPALKPLAIKLAISSWILRSFRTNTIILILFLLLHYRCFTYMSICACQGSKEARSIGTRIIDSCESPCGCLEQTPTPLQEHPVPLTGKSPPHPPRYHILFIVLAINYDSEHKISICYVFSGK